MDKGIHTAKLNASVGSRQGNGYSINFCIQTVSHFFNYRNITTTTKMRESRKAALDHLISCQGVKLFLLKDVTITNVTTVTVTTVTNYTTVI